MKYQSIAVSHVFLRYTKNNQNTFTAYNYPHAVMTQLSIIFLGTSGSWPTVKRNVTSIAVKRGSEVILFDCGEGTQRQFQKSKLSYMQISKIFITHFHGDHFLGLPGLIQTMQLNARDIPLHIYGPAGISHLMLQLLSLGYFSAKYEIITHEVSDGDTLTFDEYTIHAKRTDHGIPSLAYCIEGPLFSKLQQGHTIALKDGTKINPDRVLGPPRPGRKIVYSGDTRPCEPLIDFAQNADVLIHEATFDSEQKDIAGDYGHSTTLEAADIARKANVDRLFLVHVSPRYLDAKPLQDEAQNIFTNTIIPRDFDEYTIPLKK